MPDDRPIPRFTVAIGTYKRAQELARAVQSALDQDGDDFEVLVGDDASPDETPVVMARLADDPRVRYYRNDVNLGLQANIHKVCRGAAGRYVVILTDDDYLLPGALDRLRTLTSEQPDVAYILSHLYSIDEATGAVKHVHRTFKDSRRLAPGLDAMWAMCGSAWVLSRQVLKADAVDWAAWSRYGENIFFPIIVAGRLLLDAPSYYLAEPLVGHTFFNRVHWERFGRNALEIELALAADRTACMRAILAGRPATPATQRYIDRWEVGNLRAYLLQHPAGFFDLVRAVGRRQAYRLLDERFQLTPPLRRELARWPLRLAPARAVWALKGALRRRAPGLAQRARALRGGWGHAR